MKRLLRLYPAAWRQRYESEMAELLDDIPPQAGVALDLVRGAIGAHLHGFRGPTRSLATTEGGFTAMKTPIQRHATALAVLALLLVAPTLALVGISLFGHELGMVELAVWADPIIVAATQPWAVNYWLLAAPVVAFLLAIVPLVRMSAARAEDEVRMVVAFHPRALNMAIALLALATGAVLVGHHLNEVMLEAR